MAGMRVRHFRMPWGLIASALVALVLAWPPFAAAQDGAGESGGGRIVKVGVFPVDPIVSVTPGGEPRGFFVDLIEEIARQEGWLLVYVPGSWNEGLERLKDGRIDLMTSVAPVPERRKWMRFSEESVLMVWGQVFVHPRLDLATILDLQDKRVALAKGDINGRNFRRTAEAFGVTCRYIEVPTHADIFRMVQSGEADAGVAPNIYGVAHDHEYGLVATSIIFSPVESHFAAPVSSDGELLAAIDRHLASWKKDPDSSYYRSMQKWLAVSTATETKVPVWLLWAAGAVLGLSLVLFLWNRALQRKFQARTRELRESEAKARAIFDQSFQFIGLLDPDGTLLDVNRTALDFIGAAKDEVVGKPFWEAPWWSHSVKAQEEVKRGIEVARSGEVFRSEATHPARDGSMRLVEFTIKGIRNDNGEVRWLVPEGRDVTEYRQALERLARLGQAVEQTADMVVITDPEGRVEYVNPAFCSVTGFASDDALGRSIRFLCPPDLDDDLYTPHWFAERGLEPWRGRTRPVKKYGGQLEVDASLSPIVSDGGEVVAYVLVQRDITQVEALEQSLRQAQRLEAVGTLAAGIAHDFNNILAAIFGYTELAQLEVPENSPVAEYLDEVIIGAERARALVRQILVFGRRTEHEWQTLALRPLVREVLDLLRSTLPATITVDERLEADGTVMGDPGQIHQVVMNLCTNAFQALEERGGTMTLTLEREEIQPEADLPADGPSPGPYLVLGVSDNGPGMPPELQDKIFEPYFTTKDPGKGSGLGLAVVHGIVQAHRGFIRVESEQGKGTCFRIYLPENEEAGSGPEGAATLDRVAGQGEHILFVDDESILARLADQFFSGRGYRVTALDDSLSAWEQFRADPDAFDLVISDQTMPGMTGVDLAAQILSLRPGLPFILCTGYSAEVSREEATSLGISRFVQKPVEMERLGLIVRGLLDRRVGQ